MHQEELTFDIVDDLTIAHARGKLPATGNGVYFSTPLIAPYIELFCSPANRQFGPNSSWLNPNTHRGMRFAVASAQSLWLDDLQRSGFMRTVFDPTRSDDDISRTQFLLAARRAAEASGLPKSSALSMAAALRELESNIIEHSENSGTGLLAFQSTTNEFEFVAADNGVGVLTTLRNAPEYSQLRDHGRALQLALQDGVSRHGHDPIHGNGFRDLFLGLSSLNADLRFRSGDHALTVSGWHPDLKSARLEQKSPFVGFLAAVRCRPSARSP